MSSKFFIDFDGTITDVWARYFAIYKDFFCLSDNFFNEYKRLKYLYQNDRELIKQGLMLDEAAIVSFADYKRKWLEDGKYLALDTLLIDRSLLRKLFQTTDSKVLTVRNSESHFMMQLDSLGISYLKEFSVVLPPAGINTKLDWLRETAGNDTFFMIGDSEIDMQVGKIPGCTTLFVQTGLRDCNQIPAERRPDMIFKNLSNCLTEFMPFD